MKIEDFVKIGDDGKLVVDNAGFTASLDRERQQASDTSAKNTESKLRDQIKRELEEEAKLSAEEKLKKDYEEKFASLIARERELDKKTIVGIYKDASISDDEIEQFVSLMGDDSARNIEVATKIATARKKANEEAIKKFKEDAQFEMTVPNDASSSSNKISDGAKYANELNTGIDFSTPINFD